MSRIGEKDYKELEVDGSLSGAQTATHEGVLGERVLGRWAVQLYIVLW